MLLVHTDIMRIYSERFAVVDAVLSHCVELWMSFYRLIVSTLLLLLLLMTFIGRKLRHAANAPSQPLHDNSYPRTGTFSVVSWTLAVKCSADGDRLEDCSTRLARERQNCGLRSLYSYVEQWVDRTQQSAGDTDRRVMTLARSMPTGMAEPCRSDICIPIRLSWK